MKFIKDLFSAIGDTEGETNSEWKARAFVLVVVIILALIQLNSEA